jgi:Fe-S-cluster containining protein
MDKPHFVILNSSVRFDGQCTETKPFCGAVCCKTTIVLLTPEEKDNYDYVSPTEGCNCRGCQAMRSSGQVSLRRKDTGCVYLDGAGNCSIYDDRPKQCRDFDCEKTWYKLYPVGATE